MCTPQSRSATVPARSTSVRVVSISPPPDALAHACRTARPADKQIPQSEISSPGRASTSTRPALSRVKIASDNRRCGLPRLKTASPIVLPTANRSRKVVPILETSIPGSSALPPSLASVQTMNTGRRQLADRSARERDMATVARSARALRSASPRKCRRDTVTFGRRRSLCSACDQRPGTDIRPRCPFRSGGRAYRRLFDAGAAILRQTSCRCSVPTTSIYGPQSKRSAPTLPR